MDKREKIIEVLNGLYDYQLLDIYNEYADNNRYERIERVDEADDVFCGMTPTQIINSLADDFNSGDDFMKQNGYGYFETTSDLTDWVYVDEIADYIIDNENSLGCDDIQDILDEEEDESEEEEW